MRLRLVVLVLLLLHGTDEVFKAAVGHGRAFSLVLGQPMLLLALFACFGEEKGKGEDEGLAEWGSVEEEGPSCLLFRAAHTHIKDHYVPQ